MTSAPRKLIEDSLPLADISDSCAREKDIHVGLPPNFHAWWSRKPLGAARAILVASLVDAPDESLSESEAKEARRALHGLVMEASDPELTSDPRRLAAFKARLKKLVPNLPTFCDPFAGGGSIPLEAARLGLPVVCGDLNPVASLICKAMIQCLPRFAQATPLSERSGKARSGARALGALEPAPYAGLIADAKRYGELVKARAEKRIGHCFPPLKVKQLGKDIDPVAWIWARTVTCPNPGCGYSTPLVNKFWLSKHSGNEAWAEPVPAQGKRFDFKIHTQGTPPPGSVNKKGAKCLACKQPIPLSHIRAEGRARRLGQVLMAMAVSANRRRLYLPPTEEQARAAEKAPETWAPETELPEKALGFRVQNYGIVKHAQLFTKRQLATVATFADVVNELQEDIRKEAKGDEAYVDAIMLLMAFAVDRLVQTNSTLVRWLVRTTGTSKGTPAPERQIVSMSWEFAEGHPFGDSVGSWDAALKNVLGAIPSFPTAPVSSEVVTQSAEETVSQTGEGSLISTDPPYFDNIGYSDLSDFFYIWLRRTLRGRFRGLFDTVLVPKSAELVASADRHGGDKEVAENHFNAGLRKVFAQIAERAGSYPATIYYAFKQTEEESDDEDGDELVSSTGWEKLLDALVGSGLRISGTWPVRTERKARMRALGSNALASSVVLVCRPKERGAIRITKGEFRKLLRAELAKTLGLLMSSNIAPVDIAQAAIGPGMAIYSSHSSVLEADGSAMTVREALQVINAVLDEVLSANEGEVDPYTRFAVTWFASNGWSTGSYGDAETLAKARNISVAGVVEAGFLHSAAGKVRLLKRDELPSDWDPLADTRLTVWEGANHLIKQLEGRGEVACAMLLQRMGTLAIPARDLAYRMYGVCEKNRWSDDARAFNGLVVAWPELEKLAAASPQSGKSEQLELTGMPSVGKKAKKRGAR